LAVRVILAVFCTPAFTIDKIMFLLYVDMILNITVYSDLKVIFKSTLINDNPC
jgi:hypothetical protein